MEHNDCTVRALANATGLSYHDAYTLAADAGRKPGRGIHSKVLIARAKLRGLRFRKLRFGQRTVARFIREYPRGRFYVHVYAHAFAIVNGDVSDRTGDMRRITGAWEFIGGGYTPPPPKQPKPAKPVPDPRIVKHDRTLAAIKRWETKAKRAETALRKLRRSLRAQERKLFNAVVSAAQVQS